MLHIFIDTCVWLDLAKDHQQESLLSVLEELVRQKHVVLFVPRIVITEFARNKERIAEDSCRSLSSVMKRVKQAVDKFGDPKGKRITLQQLNDVDHKIPILGEAAVGAIRRIEKLLGDSQVLEPTNEVKLLAAQRAIDMRAPFHKQKNSINDALLIEMYAAHVRATKTPGERFAFVTHNTQDFSHPASSSRLPHPDMGLP